MPNVKLGFIGLGKMGTPMACRLVSNGYDVTVFDLESTAMRKLTKLGGRMAKSPRQVASRAEIVLTCLPSLQAIEEVVLGKAGVCRGTTVKTFCDLSTTGPDFAARLSQALASQGIKMLDAPVTGGVRRAAEGTLAILVSGNKRSLDDARAVFNTLGKVFYISSKPGDGQVMKLVNNLLSAVGTAAAYEAFVLGVKAGLDPDIMVEVVNNGTGRNDATLNKLPRSVLPRTFDYGSNMEITYKDISLCMAMAEKLGVTMLIGNTAKQLWAYGAHHGGAKRDSSTLITFLENWAGVKVIGKAAASRYKRGSRTHEERENTKN